MALYRSRPNQSRPIRCRRRAVVVTRVIRRIHYIAIILYYYNNQEHTRASGLQIENIIRFDHSTLLQIYTTHFRFLRPPKTASDPPSHLRLSAAIQHNILYYVPVCL